MVNWFAVANIGEMHIQFGENMLMVDQAETKKTRLQELLAQFSSTSVKNG